MHKKREESGRKELNIANLLEVVFKGITSQ